MWRWRRFSVGCLRDCLGFFDRWSAGSVRPGAEARVELGDLNRFGCPIRGSVVGVCDQPEDCAADAACHCARLQTQSQFATLTRQATDAERLLWIWRHCTKLGYENRDWDFDPLQILQRLPACLPLTACSDRGLSAVEHPTDSEAVEAATPVAPSRLLHARRVGSAVNPSRRCIGRAATQIFNGYADLY